MLRGFPGGSVGKDFSGNAGQPGSIPGLGRSPGKGNVNPLQYSSLENPHGQRSLVGYSPWGRKELDITERLTLHFLMLRLNLQCMKLTMQLTGALESPTCHHPQQN